MILEFLQKLLEFYVWLTGDKQIYDRVEKWYIIFVLMINDPWWQSLIIWSLFWFYVILKRKWREFDIFVAIIMFLFFFSEKI